MATIKLATHENGPFNY